MDLERVALEAVKLKVQEIFNKINVTTSIEGKNILIRIELPQEIMNEVNSIEQSNQPAMPGLDKEAQAAANELLGRNNE